ncbi:hypothetical protein STENM223S_06783 [Streptomyces tendae]
MQALAYRTLAEFEPGAAAHAQHYADKALALRVDAQQRSKIFDYLSMASALLHRRRPRTGRPLRAARPGVDGPQLLAPHLGPAAPDVPADRRVRRYPKIQELREEIKLALPKPRKGGTARGLTAPRAVSVSCTPPSGGDPRHQHAGVPHASPHRTPRTTSWRTPRRFGPRRSRGARARRRYRGRPGVPEHQAVGVQQEQVADLEGLLGLPVPDPGAAPSGAPCGASSARPVRPRNSSGAGWPACAQTAVRVSCR